VKNNLKHGNGKEVFGNEDIYEGDYTNGKPNGYGTYTWKNRSLYKGNFTNGLRNGSGIWYKKSNDDAIDIYKVSYEI